MQEQGNTITTHCHEHGMFVRDCEPVGRRGTVVCIHGLGESGLCFEHLVRYPGLREWRLLIPDLPGYGRSPWRPEPLGLADQADHLAEWLRERGERRIVVVGHSLGGVTGLLLCERHPDLVAAFVDVDGNKSPDDCVFSGQAAAMDLAAFQSEGFDELRAAVFAKGQKDLAHRGYYVSLRLADPRAYHRNSLELLELSGREDLAERLAALPLPARYIAGIPDGVSDRSLELLAAAGVDWIGVKPSGHWPFIDQPEQFVAVLGRTLAEWFPGQ